MTELQLLAALGALEEARERLRARGSRGPSAPHVLAAVGGLAAGWLARGLMLRSDR